MYWKEIPVQVQARDELERVSQPLDRRFQEGADALAMFDGSAGTDAYLAAWEWGPETEAPGPAKDAAATVADRYNSSFPRDFVTLVRQLHQSGRRDPRPGALDHLMERKARPA
jgi:hypothetical protein